MEYRILKGNIDKLKKDLNELAKDGWRSILMENTSYSGNDISLVLILERERKVN